jgi:hypothetical protein
LLNFRAAALLAAIVLSVSVPGRADLLIGTQLTGSLQILGSGNLYSPATQTLNTGTTAFSFSIPTVMTIGAQIDINAQGDTLTLTDLVQAGQPGYGWTQTFTDSIFTNFNPVLVSSNFAGLQVSQTPTTMTFSWAGSASVTQSTTFSAVFNLVDPPPFTPVAADEPSAMMLLTAGLAAIGLVALRRKSASSAEPASNG